MHTTVMELEPLESVAARLASREDPAQCWLWCRECERFFQARHLRRDSRVEGHRCPFADCTGAGLGVALFLWNDHRDDRWPVSEVALSHGLRSPSMASYWNTRAVKNRERVVAQFRRSRAYRELDERGYDLCWTERLLEIGGWCHCEPHQIERDVFEWALLYVLPEWMPIALADVPCVVQELRAFLRFANDELGSEETEQCLELLGITAHELIRDALLQSRVGPAKHRRTRRRN